MSQRRGLSILLFAGWVVFLLIAAVMAALLIVVGRPYSTIALALMVGAMSVVVVRQMHVGGVVRRVAAWLEATRVIQFARRNSLAVTHVLAVGAVYLMVASAQMFQPGRNDQQLLLAVGLFLLGGLVFGGALWLAARTAHGLPLPGLATARADSGRVYWWLVGAGGVLLLALAEISGRLLKLDALAVVSTHVQFVMLLGGIGLIAAGLGGSDWFAASAVRTRHSSRNEIVLVAGIMLLALVLRGWQLGSSIRFLVDELGFSNGVIVQEDQTYQPLLQQVDDIAAFPHVFPYFQTRAVELLGHTLTGLRASNAVFGMLTVGALYLLAKTLFDRKTALIAALLLATFPPHLHFSRLGVIETPSAFWGTLALAFLARSVVSGRRRDYVLAGVLLGITHYFNEGGRLLYTPLALAWLAGLGVVYRRLPWRHLLVGGLALLLVAAPVYYTLFGLNIPLTARMETTNVALNATYWEELPQAGGWRYYARGQLLNPLLVYVHVPDPTLYYHGDTAMLLPLLVPGFLLGVWYSVWRWRKPGLMLLLLWLLATTAGNSLLTISVSAVRYVITHPAVVLLVAVGIRYTVPLILPEALVSKRLSRLAVVSLVVLMAAVQVGYYFGVHIPAYNRDVRAIWGSRDPQDAVLRSLNFPPGTRIHIVTHVPLATDYAQGLLRFLRPARDLTLDVVLAEDFTAGYLDDLSKRYDHAFFIEPDDETVLETLQTHFYLLPPEDSPYDDIALDAQFELYYAPYLRGVSS
ncbi:MAG: glycosyltransferase family 39 protein [Anaerolineae bacterium]|nr:glycosyltransferase family 39 protein [Anaerolineae bacterium]